MATFIVQSVSAVPILELIVFALPQQLVGLAWATAVFSDEVRKLLSPHNAEDFSVTTMLNILFVSMWLTAMWMTTISFGIALGCLGYIPLTDAVGEYRSRVRAWYEAWKAARDDPVIKEMVCDMSCDDLAGVIMEFRG